MGVMESDPAKLAESIRNGSYFSKARGWYQVMYIGPVSERSLFLLIAILSVFVGIFSTIAVMRLMPLTSRDGILVPAPTRLDDVQVSLIKLADKGEAVDPAVMRFFVMQYVAARESYTAEDFTVNSRFVRAHSDAATYNAYAEAYTLANPESPFAALGDIGQRQLQFEAVRVSKLREGRGSAEITIATQATVAEESQSQRFTARLDFTYSGLASEVVDDPKTGQPILKLGDPQFQVVNYVLTPIQ